MPGPRARSKALVLAAAATVLLAGVGCPAPAFAQACCAGASAVTPGRLELHEDALVGLQTQAASVYGSFSPTGRFTAPQPGDTEFHLEQDVFAALRVLGRGQMALLVPFVETQRTTRDGSHAGGGVGDVNLSVRYDFWLAGQSRYLPGIALLAGVTLPSGTPVESDHSVDAVDTTGIGALQGSLALALEQTFGPWLVNLTGIAAQRAPTYSGQLATQWTALVAGAYTFPNDAAAVLFASYAYEGDGTDASGKTRGGSSKPLTTVGASLLWPFGDAWRVIGGAQMNPPIGSLGANQPANAGLTITVIRSWS